MVIADPAGLLARIPELEMLVDDPRVRRAVERGNPLGLYRILWWGLRLGRFAKHRALVASLLTRRRMFLTPIGSAPTLFTYNGIGTTAYGRDDVDANDGTYVLTQVVSVIFVPIFPLAQFLVRDAQSNGSRRAWTFIGKVPLGPAAYAWNRLLALGVALSVLISMGSVWRSSRYHEVHIVNGLGVPVRATLANQKVDVASGSHGAVTVRVGRHPLTITRLDGRPIESQELEVQSGARHVLCWNVLGAAPVFRETLTYTKNPTDQEAAISVGCGEERIVYDQVADLWVDPPKSVSLSSSTSEVTRGHVGLTQGGAKSCAIYLAGKGKVPQAAEIARRAAEVSDYEDEITTLAAALIHDVRGGDEALAWSRTALSARPTSVELHRLYQTYATRLGKRGELLPEYKSRYEKDGTSADAGYLLARLEAPVEAVGLLEQLVNQFPKHIASRRAHAFNEYQLRHFQQAVGSWTVLRDLEYEAWAEQLPLVTRAMVGMGRGTDALHEVESAFAKNDAKNADLAELYGEIAAGLGQNGEKLIVQLKDKVTVSRATWLRVEAGLPVQPADLAQLDEPVLREAAEIRMAARAAPDDALTRAARTSERVLRGLGEAVWTLLYAESVRREPEGAAAKALAKTAQVSAAEMQSVLGFLKTGVVDPELAEASFEVRAAAQFVRSRMPTLAASERRRLETSARQDDLLHGAVTAAIDGWKH